MVVGRQATGGAEQMPAERALARLRSRKAALQDCSGPQRFPFASWCCMEHKDKEAQLMGMAPAESETHRVEMPRRKGAATWRTSRRSRRATAKDATTPQEKMKRGTAAHTTVHVVFSRNGEQQEADRTSAGACRRRGTRDRRGRRAAAARPAAAPAAGGRARRRAPATHKKEKDVAHARRLHTHAREPTRGVWGRRKTLGLKTLRLKTLRLRTLRLKTRKLKNLRLKTLRLKNLRLLSGDAGCGGTG